MKHYEGVFLKERNYLLKILTIALNNIHGTNYNTDNFKFLLGPWLDEFLKIYLLRKYHMKFIKHQLIIKNDTKILIHKDFSDFIINSNNLNFNLNFFSKLQKTKNKFIYYLKKNKKINNSIYFRIKIKILFFILKKIINKKTTLLVNSKFDKFTLIKLFFLSGFKIVPFFHYNIYRSNLSLFKKNFKLRESLEKEIQKHISKKYLSKLIIDNIPTSYVEDFSNCEKLSKKIYPNKPKTIFTTTSHLDDEILKFAILRWSIVKKPKVYISQHGGNYSVSNQFGLGYHDYEISDKYFTWGYKYRKKDIPSNVQQAIAKLNYYKNYKKNFFTFILGPNIENDFQRYVYQNVDYDKLYENRLAFIKNFNNSKNLIFKKYFENRYSNQDSQSTIKKKLNITNNNITNNFQIIFQSKVLIFDYFSTMFFEVINLDIPFIFILDEKNFFFSKIGYDLLDFLKRNNLLFKSGKEAAIYLNKINDIEVWWQTSIDKNKLNQIKTKVSNVKFKNLQFWLEQFKN